TDPAHGPCYAPVGGAAMKTRYLVFLSLVAGAFLLPGSGCGGAKSCQDACEAREACPDVIPGEKSCELQCKDEEALVKVALCEEQQQVYYDCLTELTDQCDVTSTCATSTRQR
ncbi:MAG: hypothetical protein V9H26_22700, partial [Verrucomicrobiota bacterium]